jgi:lipopolysaccharide/colanic/teichoic acid biosynthesis glycosyltransferase
MDVIYNWCDDTTLKSNCGELTRLAGADRFSILFAGTMGLAQGLDSVLLAAQICRATVPAAEFVFMGGGVDRSRLESMAKEMHLDNVRFLPRQPMHTMGNVLAGADALLVHLKDDPLFRITIPSKTQAYLAARKPILMGVRGDAADLVKRSQSGVLCEPGNPQSIAEAVKELTDACPEHLAAMGRNGRAFYERELSVYIGTRKFDRVFRAVGEKTLRFHYRQSGWRFWIKSIFDRGAALLGLILVLPLLIAVGILVWISMGRPVLFRQVRPGRSGRPFTLLKFQSMQDLRDKDGRLLPDSERITRLGRFLRASSLDELPQLLNVLRGEMSFVGPRPLLMEYLDRYTPEQSRRHEVRPGITGWAQVNGRNALSWEEKFRLDVWYVDHASILLDLRILGLTILRVIHPSGISRQGHATMPEFFAVRDQVTEKELAIRITPVEKERKG